MANNNYANFTYGGPQYNSPAGGAGGYNTGQVSYPAVTNATYANAAAYQNAVAAGHGGGGGAAGYGATSGGAAAGGGYGGGYGDYRSMPTYDASKTFYQQSPASYAAAPVAAATVSKTHYSAPPVKNVNVGKSGGVSKDKANGGGSKPPPATTAATNNTFTSYDAALYSAASMYVAQHHVPGGPMGSAGPANVNSKVPTAAGWNQYRGAKSGPGGAGSARGGGGSRSKPAPRPQQLHYCEVCKISCAGPQTYREHLEGQKHKKREASLKLQASAQSTSQNRGNNYHCELCDVTCTGNDAYAAHVRGAKHQKVVKLHQKLGKPIPSEEPKKLLTKINFVPANNTSIAEAGGGENGTSGGITNNNNTAVSDESKSNISVGSIAASSALSDGLDQMQTDDGSLFAEGNMDNIKPVGGEYIEELKDEEGKILSFNCKLCDCKFNDPNAKEMHMKGRRHRLQYKRKVQPDLVVDFKPTPRQRRLAEARAQRALMQTHRGGPGGFGEEHDGSGGGGGGGSGSGGGGGGGMFWDEQRRRAQYDDEYDYSNWLARSFSGPQRGFGGRMGANGPPPFFGMMPGGVNPVRRPESTDDRHAVARHAEIYPKEEELQTIQRIVSHTERALKFVSDALAEKPNDETAGGAQTIKKEKTDSTAQVKDGRDNQMLSFQKEADGSGNVRLLKGVMRVGFLAKGLLLHGDNSVELVVLCSEKPTNGLLKRVATELPIKLKEVAGDMSVAYTVELNASQSALLVRDECVSVRISLTSPLLREAAGGGGGEEESVEDNAEDGDDVALLPREPCLRALAELRHAKWFQARATGLQSCVMVIRILRDLCQRVPSWQALPQWSLELLVEKVISSAGFPISPGDCLRRIMESVASGFVINGPGLLDPCEKDPQDALGELTKQQREDLTVSAQLFLRYIAFRQIYKVLGMDQLPAMKFPMRPWRLNRKRRRSNSKPGVGEDGTGDGSAGGVGGKDHHEAGGEDSASDGKIPKTEKIF